MDDFQKDLALIASIGAVPTILDVICRTTGMGFAAVARVTGERWIACSVKDEISFGLKPGGELQLETTICNEIRQHRNAVVIDHVAEDDTYACHATPRQYGFQSYISMPIILKDGSFFGTLCAIDPKPAKLKTPAVIGMFKMFAELIALHIETTERLLESEARLKVEREAAELREEFIAVLGHDLRNPLGALRTGVVLLQELSGDPKAARVAAMMDRSVTRMSELIEDVMDFARGRLGGGIALEGCAEESPEPVLRQAVEEARAMRPDKTIEMAFDLIDPVVHDKRRLAQLFTNLLGNALTHGKDGEPVRVHARSQGGRFELAVENAAEPIPAETMDRLFQPFARGDTSGQKQGLGLGLYIASEIAKAHGGKIEVKSDVDGTRFTFRMDGAPAA
ncbi:GAF domain-containing sensor histidine kinase [Haloferula sp. BvORR071]|uniref:GAF domain-containing sensor histidine kinase n=1 Tax=Haloferula sp. BvORR071 TaxID=1396141 RepID=UPI00054D27ED|nr:GAF domain-containing sensor histidine kinase [Haloferula sp. BvORR071]